MITALVALLLLADTAAAEPSGAQAEALFREGLKAYDAKQYARAIESFEAAHKLSPLPEILFDIAMARRALGDCRRAVEGFDTFIAAAPADDPLLARARMRRAELASCAASDEKAATAGAAVVEALPAAPLPLTVNAPAASAAPALLIAPASAASPPRGERTWLQNTCIASAGGTAVLGLGGLVFGLQARSAEQEVESAVIWDPAIASADERGRTYGRVASTLLISAGVTTAIAAVSCIATARSRNGH